MEYHSVCQIFQRRSGGYNLNLRSIEYELSKYVTNITIVQFVTSCKIVLERSLKNPAASLCHAPSKNTQQLAAEINPVPHFSCEKVALDKIVS